MVSSKPRQPFPESLWPTYAGYIDFFEKHSTNRLNEDGEFSLGSKITRCTSYLASAGRVAQTGETTFPYTETIWLNS